MSSQHASPSQTRSARGASKAPSRTLSTWKKATLAEGVGVLVVLVFLVVVRPGGGEAAAVAAAVPDVMEARAVGADPDGTVVLDTGARIHLLGVSMPTAEDPPQVRAAAFRGLDRLMQGRPVLVEFDPVLPSKMQAGQPVRIAYVWLLDADGQRNGMANALLLSRGLGRPMTALKFRHQAAFLEATLGARERGLGVWQAPPSASVRTF